MIQTRHDIVLFLGAGFSAHAGLPVMSRFTERAVERLRDVLALSRGTSDDGYREGAALVAEAGQVWERVVALCSSRLAGQLMNPNNIEDLFSFVEALSEHGLKDVKLGDHTYSLDYVATMMRLWIWSVYHYCPIASTSAKEFWKTHREPYASLAAQLEHERLRNRVCVLTTNYDLIFESLLLHETTSLRADAGHGLRFTTRVDDDDVRIPQERLEVPILKLHGSVDLFTIETPAGGWLEEESHDGRRLPAVPGNTRPRLLQADRLDKAHHAQGRLAVLQVNSMLKLRRRHGESLTPAIAPPSFYKADRYDWLRHTWYQALQALVNSKNIIFVGYSMPPTDGHLRGLFATSLTLRANRPSVRVLDSSADVIKGYRDAFHISDSTRLLHATFESADAIARLKQWLDEASSEEASHTRGA